MISAEALKKEPLASTPGTGAELAALLNKFALPATSPAPHAIRIEFAGANYSLLPFSGKVTGDRRRLMELLARSDFTVERELGTQGVLHCFGLSWDGRKERAGAVARVRFQGGEPTPLEIIRDGVVVERASSAGRRLQSCLAPQDILLQLADTTHAAPPSGSPPPAGMFVLELDGRRHLLRLSEGGSSRLQSALAQVLKAKEFAIEHTLPPSGTLCVLGFTWQGGTERAGQLLRISSKNGKLTPECAWQNGKQVARRGTHGLMIPCEQLSETLQKLSLGPAPAPERGPGAEQVVFEFEGRRHLLPLSNGYCVRKASLIDAIPQHSLHVEAVIPPSGMLAVYGLRWFGGVARAGSVARVRFDEGHPTVEGIWSGGRLVERRDANGELRSALPLRELVAAVAEKRPAPAALGVIPESEVVIDIGGERMPVALKRSMDHARELLAERIAAGEEITFERRVPSSGKVSFAGRTWISSRREEGLHARVRLVNGRVEPLLLWRDGVVLEESDGHGKLRSAISLAQLLPNAAPSPGCATRAGHSHYSSPGSAAERYFEILDKAGSLALAREMFTAECVSVARVGASPDILFQQGATFQRLATLALLQSGRGILPEALLINGRINFPDFYLPQERELIDAKYGGSATNVAETVAKYSALLGDDAPAGKLTIMHLKNDYRTTDPRLSFVRLSSCASPELVALGGKLLELENSTDHGQHLTELKKLSLLLDSLIAIRLGIGSATEYAGLKSEDWRRAACSRPASEQQSIRNYLKDGSLPPQTVTLPIEQYAFDRRTDSFREKLSLLPADLQGVAKAAVAEARFRDSLRIVYRSLRKIDLQSGTDDIVHLDAVGGLAAALTQLPDSVLSQPMIFKRAAAVWYRVVASGALPSSEHATLAELAKDPLSILGRIREILKPACGAGIDSVSAPERYYSALLQVCDRLLSAGGRRGAAGRE